MSEKALEYLMENWYKLLKCPSCKEEITVSPPPAWLKEIFPVAKYFVNVMLSSKDSPKSTITEGVALTCPRCGASLIVDGEDRIVPCEYYKLHVYLPDDLWLRLYPGLIKAEWFIVYDDKEIKKWIMIKSNLIIY